MEWDEYRQSIKCPSALQMQPVAEAIVELRFASKWPAQAVFGMIFESLESLGSWTIESLPVLEIPEAVRFKDNDLMKQPHYRLKDNNLTILIGPQVIAFTCLAPYMGWNNFSQKFSSYIESIRNRKVFSRIHRVGVRFINFFDQDVRDKIILNISSGNVNFNPPSLSLRSKIIRDGWSSTIRIESSARLRLNDTHQLGSVLDIDVSSTEGGMEISNVETIIHRLHDEEKRDFFALLKPEYVSELLPSYDHE